MSNLQPASAASNRSSTSASTETALLGADYNSLTGGFTIPVSERGKNELQKVLGKISSGQYVYENKPCLCGEAREEVVCTVDRYRIPHRSVLCPSCGLVRTNPRLTPASYVDFYTHHYRAIYERPGHTAETLFSVQEGRSSERAAYILQHSKVAAGGSVLEIGCGGGWNLIPFQKKGYSVQGYDYDEDYMMAGRSKGLTLHRGGVDDVLATGQTFDLVILSHVLEHILEPQEELVKISKLLNPNGLLFIEVPSLFAVTSHLPRYWQNAHTYSFVPETLTTLMNNSGYDVVAINDVVASLWKKSSDGHKIHGVVDSKLAHQTRSFLVDREGRFKMKNRLSWLHAFWVWLHSFKK